MHIQSYNTFLEECILNNNNNYFALSNTKSITWTSKIIVKSIVEKKKEQMQIHALTLLC